VCSISTPEPLATGADDRLENVSKDRELDLCSQANTGLDASEIIVETADDLCELHREWFPVC
jgi:hypothetical protein